MSSPYNISLHDHRQMFSNPSEILKAKLREHIEEIKEGPSIAYLGHDEES